MMGRNLLDAYRWNAIRQYCRGTTADGSLHLRTKLQNQSRERQGSAVETSFSASFLCLSKRCGWQYIKTAEDLQRCLLPLSPCR